MESIFKQIKEEREKQIKKWGDVHHTPMEWIPILVEEVGEVSKEALEPYFKKKGFHQIQHPGNYFNYRIELIQLAAVCVAMIQNIDDDTKSNR